MSSVDPPSSRSSIEMTSLPAFQKLDEIANQVPIVTPPKSLPQSFEAAKQVDWKKVGIRALSFAAGTALGVLTGLAIAGFMTTPVGWALAGGALFFVLMGSYAYGGPKEFFEALKIASAGFVFGMGLGGLQGANMAAAAGHTSIAKAGKTGVFFGGLGMTVVSLWATLLSLFIEWGKTAPPKPAV